MDDVAATGELKEEESGQNEWALIKQHGHGPLNGIGNTSVQIPLTGSSSTARRLRLVKELGPFVP